MGANQSGEETREGPGEGIAAPTGEMKTDFYVLLGVERTADQDEIKKAYKKKALELHPDRNFDDVERTTKLFTEVQAAYEVLSDPQERAWYDSHREQILRDDDDGSGPQFQNEVKITTSDELIRKFSLFSTRMDFRDDSAKGFYSLARGVFKMLASEEVLAAEWANEDAIHYPDFGGSKSDYEDYVKPFYAEWMNFRTVKSFSWEDMYRYQDAPDRRVKRLMEKENKKARDSAIREFNDTVRQFVLFIRKRDPRYMPNFQTDEERTAAAKSAAKDQSARDRAANAAKLAAYREADWMKTDTTAENEAAEEFDSEDEEIQEEFECVACSKTFKTEKQVEAHERSKKHLKTVNELKRQMRRENKEFGLEDNESVEPSREGSESPTETIAEDLEDEDEGDIGDDTELPQTEFSESRETEKDETEEEELPGDGTILSKTTESAGTQHDLLLDDSGDDKEMASTTRSTDSPIKNPLLSANDIDDSSSDFASLSLSEKGDADKPKLGKAKEKRLKKAAKAATEAAGLNEKCAKCGEAFPSRTKLFEHLKEMDHGAPVAKAKAKGKKKTR